MQFKIQYTVNIWTGGTLKEEVEGPDETVDGTFTQSGNRVVDGGRGFTRSRRRMHGGRIVLLVHMEYASERRN